MEWGSKPPIRFAYSWEGRPEVAEKPFPGWIASQYWELTAKTPGPSTLDQQKLMMQKFLEEHCGLVTHRGSREGQIYAMTLGKNGNFEESTEAAAFGPQPPHKAQGYDLLVSGYRISMPEFALRLSGIVKQPIVDKTGLSGRYDLSFVVPQNFIPALDGDESHASLILDKPQLFRNLEKIGLKFESQKGEYPVFIIDKINKPEELGRSVQSDPDLRVIYGSGSVSGFYARITNALHPCRASGVERIGHGWTPRLNRDI